MLGAAALDDVADEVLLAVVGGEDGDFVRRVPPQPEVAEEVDDVLGLSEVLEEVGRWDALSLAQEVRDVDELVVVEQPRDGVPEGPGGRDVGEVSEVAVPPVVERGNAGPGAALGVELGVGGPETHEAGEEGLVEVRVLLERLVLHDGRQLVVVPDHDDPLQARDAVLGLLKEHRDEGLDLQDLGALLHEQIVVFEAEAQELPPLEGRVSAGHRDHPSLTGHQVVDSVLLSLEQLKRTALLQLPEHRAQVPEAALGGLPVLLERLALEQRLRRRRKVLGERKLPRDLLAEALPGHAGLELLPAAQDVQEPEVPCRLARVGHVGRHAHLHCHLLHLRKELQTALEHRVDSTDAGKVEGRVQVLLTRSRASRSGNQQQMRREGKSTAQLWGWRGEGGEERIE